MYNFRRSLLCALIRAGYRVTVLAPSDDTFRPLLEAAGCAFVPVEIQAKGINPYHDLKLCASLYFRLRKLRPDFCFFYTIKPNIYGCMAAGLAGIGHIAVTTGLGYTFIARNRVAAVARRLYKFAFRSAQQVWFLNEDDRKAFLKEKLVKQEKTFVLPGEGIDTDYFDGGRYAPEKAPVSFLLMARMLWDKGVGEYVAAARVLKKKYPDAVFRLLGFVGVDNPSAIPEPTIRGWVDEGVVEYLGTASDVRPYIAAASCVVLPSYREGIPVSLLEGSAMGKPLITTDTAGCRDTVDPGASGFLCRVGDAESLAGAMEKIIRMPEVDRRRMGLCGRKKMEREFSAARIVGCYRAVLRRNGL